MQIRLIRRLALACAAVTLLVPLAACGKAQAPAQAPTQAAPLKVGVVLPLSGTYATLGENNLRGMEMYLQGVQSTIAGRKIELIKEDDENKPNVALQKVRKLVEQDRVDVLMGFVSSAVALAVRDYIHQKQVPTIITTAIVNDMTRSKKVRTSSGWPAPRTRCTPSWPNGW